MPLMNLTNVRDSFLKDPPDTCRPDLIPELLPLIDESVPERRIWLLRSLNGIVLLSEDDPKSPLFVRVQAHAEVETHPCYEIDFEMRPVEAPWPGARVHGVADSKERAAAMIAIAVERCGGWE
jgi:hypothetical protein